MSRRYFPRPKPKPGERDPDSDWIAYVFIGGFFLLICYGLVKGILLA